MLGGYPVDGSSYAIVAQALLDHNTMRPLVAFITDMLDDQQAKPPPANLTVRLVCALAKAKPGLAIRLAQWAQPALLAAITRRSTHRRAADDDDDDGDSESGQQNDVMRDLILALCSVRHLQAVSRMVVIVVIVALIVYHSA